MPLIDARQRLLFAHHRRDSLLRVARRYARCDADAQDAVATAVERAAHADVADEARMWGWLSRVTVNLCLEQRRRAPSPGTLARLEAWEPSGAADPAERVCDRSEAAWAAGLVAGLAERERVALRLVAADRSVGEVAAALDVSYKAAESLLSRARAVLRGQVATARHGLVVLVLPRRRRIGYAGIPVVMLVAALSTLVVAPPPATPAALERTVRPPATRQTVVRRTVTSAPAPTGVAPPPRPRQRGSQREAGTAEDVDLPPLWRRIEVVDPKSADRNGTPLVKETVDCVGEGLEAGLGGIGCR